MKTTSNLYIYKIRRSPLSFPLELLSFIPQSLSFLANIFFYTLTK